MVVLGGLELVAAGYLIHKHQQNKRDKQRLEADAAALEESQYRIFTPSPSPSSDRPSRSEHRRRRSSSRRRRSSYDRYDRHDRPHSADGKYRRESPPMPKPILKPSANYSNAQIAQQQQQQQRPPTYNAAVATGPPPMVMAAAVPQVQIQPPQMQTQSYSQDIKYGWVDDHPAQQQQRPQDPSFPPTGWPEEWHGSQAGSSASGSRRRDDRSRGRDERRSRRGRAESLSPPPSYRA